MEGVVVMFSKTKTDLDPGILLDLEILLSGELCFFFHFKNNLHKENLHHLQATVTFTVIRSGHCVLL